MIQMNMLKQKPVIHGLPSEKDGAKLIGVGVISAIVGALLVVGILRIVSGISNMTSSDDQFVNIDVPVSNGVPTTALADSVTGEILPQTDFTDYENMGMIERFNYERVFAYYLFRELTLIVPVNVDFSSIEMQEYTSVSSEGFVDDQDGVLSLFSSLKKGGWELKPRPASLFRSVSDGYQFHFEGDYRVEPSTIDSAFITADMVPTADHLQNLKESILEVAKESPVTSTGDISLLDMNSEGMYHNYLYSLDGRCSDFSEFKELLKGITQLNMPVSVMSTMLKARDNGIDWEITVKVTVK